ncbi:hypothetical protein [Paenibacillus alvei]|uniref:Uncharacterized protein n=1 Tax=Paenibacillus alvei TaxID=44250 RepID=A0AAP6ZZU1_PAEAL|nr:hypothetical protein [Paenibacillus alvei]MBG9735442.1 hypothetical protein [Paenibacillus alvei]MBG9746828.1 hypothetical protein [Paenibacillus alvei]MCY9578626.1 GNAT family N-acetyltransferase [Paenibacillus alvei]MCY9584945.1 GNAT family N-acetyltransferase [Paenibacillus alvei]NOJ72964.1 hypothetical protein [Paenibacillus alvei]
MIEFTIDCGDILLREYRIDDVEAICALTQEPAILEFFLDWNVSKELRLNWMTNYESISMGSRICITSFASMNGHVIGGRSEN